jgi:hypothetical protein
MQVGRLRDVLLRKGSQATLHDLHGYFTDEGRRAITGQPWEDATSRGEACDQTPSAEPTRANTASGELLIRGFGVQVPGGAPM